MDESSFTPEATRGGLLKALGTTKNDGKSRPTDNTVWTRLERGPLIAIDSVPRPGIKLWEYHQCSKWFFCSLHTHTHNDIAVLRGNSNSSSPVHVPIWCSSDFWHTDCNGEWHLKHNIWVTLDDLVGFAGDNENNERFSINFWDQQHHLSTNYFDALALIHSFVTR